MSDPRRSPTLDRPAATPRDGSSTGARASQDGGDRRRRRGLLPLLLGLLVLAAIAALLVALLSGGDDKASKSAQQGSGQSGASAQSGSAGGGGSEAGTLSAGGAAILPAAAEDIGQHPGDRAEGKGVVVQSVVENAEDPNALEGFWVGKSKQDRVYVEWGGDVGADEASLQPKVGDKVDLTGPVKAAPKKAQRVLNLSPADARTVQQQGAYINADDVKPAD